jgi:hypothetical protein
MHGPARWSCCLVLTMAALGLTGCPIPVSQVPLSDAASSKIDERLIGTWELDLAAFQKKYADGEGAEKTARYTIERVKDQPGTLLATGGSGEAKETVTLYVTHLAMHDYFSFGPINKEEKKHWTIQLYQMQDADHGNVYLMDEKYVAGAIDRGELPGVVERSGGGIRSILISATHDELTTFLKRHSPRCFDLKTPIACKRVK